jgi:hypothetical protein
MFDIVQEHPILEILSVETGGVQVKRRERRLSARESCKSTYICDIMNSKRFILVAPVFCETMNAGTWLVVVVLGLMDQSTLL